MMSGNIVVGNQFEGEGKKGEVGMWTCIHSTGDEGSGSGRNGEGRGRKVLRYRT